jgi:signal transduction histidine kinase/DNA-binding NarL/FixJ family response regulator
VPGALHLLVVSDAPADADRTAEALARADWQVTFTRVSQPQQLRDALGRGGFDAVLSRYDLVGWHGLQALKMLQESDLDVPFIVVAPPIGEEAVAEAMKLGAHDYVLSERLGRLPVALARELREAQVRREKRQMVVARRQMVSRSAFLAQASRRLAQSLVFEDTLSEAARVALPEAADWCVISLQAEGIVASPLTLRHVEPRKERLGQTRLAPGVTTTTTNGRRPAPKANLPAGHYEWIQPARIFSGLLSEEDSTALTMDLGYDAALNVPLWSNDRILGTMTLAWMTPARSFGLDDVGLAEELATRVALALESALLYRRAREAIRARDEFLSIAAHELNTPLATLGLQIEGMAELSRLPASDVPAALTVAEGLTRARRQVKRLGRLVSNLLDVSRLSAYRLDLELGEVDLVSTAREVIDQFGPELTRAGCELRLEAPATLRGRWDSGRIAQVLTNLLSNACKYGGRRPVEVSMGLSASEDRVTLSVRDHGIGLEEGEIDQIFELFSRAHSARPFGGLGLGLYVSRKVVEAHGGVIRARGAPGQGATFEVELPIAPPDVRPGP